MQRVSRDRAKELVDEARFGTLVVATVDDVPVIGNVPPEKRQKEIGFETCRFGDIPDEEEA